MNIDDLAMGQVKEINKVLTGGEEEVPAPIGEYVIVRSRVEGVNAGSLISAGRGWCVLKDVRRLWYFEPKNPLLSWYEGVAISGVNAKSRLSSAVPNKIIVEDYSITPCTKEAAESIRSAKINEK